tara:strand:+ start:25 stop:225 length:201 start_codon:yes stop_codon:yes gene_type:complete
MNKRNKAIEICKNLQQTIKKAVNVVISNENPMFDKPTASASKLKAKQKELMKKYNLNKNDLNGKTK